VERNREKRRQIGKNKKISWRLQGEIIVNLLTFYTIEAY